MTAAPTIESEVAGDGLRLALSGDWVIAEAAAAEIVSNAAIARAAGAARATIDLSGVGALDTAGAWIIDRARARLREGGVDAAFSTARAEHATLIEEAHFRAFEAPRRSAPSAIVGLLVDVGQSMFMAGRDLVRGVGFLGQVVASLVAMIAHPGRIRPASIVFHFESFAYRGVPIIALISFLVGCIIAQQGIFQLQRFGATPFAVDLIGLLVLRELGVLLTSIMVAGRSGSAITAEIGSMKMREEIDAMRVMGIDPVEALIVPRILALVVALPLLTFISDLSAIFGGMLVAWVYGDISPEIYLARLQSAIAFNTFAVGLIKAPFMALVIGLVASVEGFAVEGSAESLGRQVTSSVVKTIFMVILVDGLFAMFFAAIRY